MPVVFDHFGGAHAELGLEQPGFSDMLELVRTGKAYVKISGAYRASSLAPDYPDVIPLARALITANSDRIIWGSDWPHPDSVTPPGKKPTDVTPLLQIDDGRLSTSSRYGRRTRRSEKGFWSTTRHGFTASESCFLKLSMALRPLRRVTAERHRRARPECGRCRQRGRMTDGPQRTEAGRGFLDKALHRVAPQILGLETVGHAAEFHSQRPVCASDTRTCQLPPSRDWRARAIIAPNAIR